MNKQFQPFFLLFALGLLVSNPANPCACGPLTNQARALTQSNLPGSYGYSTLDPLLISRPSYFTRPPTHNFYVIIFRLYDGANYHSSASIQTSRSDREGKVYDAQSVTIFYSLNINGVPIYNASGAAYKAPTGNHWWWLDLSNFTPVGGSSSQTADWYDDNVSILADTDSVEMSCSFTSIYSFPDWDPTIIYQYGDEVNRLGQSYECIFTASTPNHPPESNPAYWQIFNDSAYTRGTSFDTSFILPDP